MQFPRHHARALIHVVAFILLASSASFADGPPEMEPARRILAVSVTAPNENPVLKSVDMRDLEHYFVAELQQRRIDATAFTSLQEQDSNAGLYVIDISIDQADVAKRPEWQWWEHRFQDVALLHVEYTLTLTRLEDDKTLGDFHYARDYRGEKFGSFSSPNAIGGAVYESLEALSTAFADSVERGDYGSEITSFQHEFSLADISYFWEQRTFPMKVFIGFTLCLALLAFFAFLFHLISALFTGVAMLFGARPAPEIVYVERRSRPLGRRKTPAVLQGYESLDGEDEDESEEEMEESA